MTFQFTKAVKGKGKARVALIGPSGSGKTMTALLIAKALGSRVALIDTENGSASKYAGEQGIPDFDTLNLGEFSPQTYVEAIHAAEEAGFEVLVIDSLSHAWTGKGGALDQVDKASKRSQSGNSFTAWREVTPHHNALVDALVQCKIHLIVTMRTKVEYVLQTNERGKQEPKKIGLAPIQREGLDYEFDIVADLDLDHNFLVTKTRCRQLDKAAILNPDEKVGQTILAWLEDGKDVPPPAKVEGSRAEGWYPTKVEFFNRAKKDLKLSPEQTAEALKSGGFKDYDVTQAADMWAAVEEYSRQEA